MMVTCSLFRILVAIAPTAYAILMNNNLPRYNIYLVNAATTMECLRRIRPFLDDGDQIRAAHVAARCGASLVLLDDMRPVIVMPVTTRRGNNTIVLRGIYGKHPDAWRPRIYAAVYCRSHHLTLRTCMPLDHAARYGFLDGEFAA